LPNVNTFVERHASKIAGVLSCFDRVVIIGTLPDICHAEAMARYLRSTGTRLFDFPRFAEPFRDEIRAQAEQVAQEHGLTIEYIPRKSFRKEERIKALLAQRGDHEGLVHIFSAMEPCESFKPWYDKASGQTFLRRNLGLCYLRVPTWAPFRLQIYF
jgi:hypothetical protein